MTEEAPKEILRLENVSKSYGSHRVLQNLSFSLASGRLIGLCGPNAAGKTTLLQLLAGFLSPTAGRVQRLVPCSYALQPEDFYPWMTVEDTLEFYEDFHKDFDRPKALRLTAAAVLPPKARLSRLSRGQQERLCLLLALSRQVPLYLLDEPAIGMDPELKRDFRRFLLQNLPAQATVIMATHLLKDFETLFDGLLLLQKGQAAFYETDELRRQKGRSIEQFYLEVTAHA